MRKVELKRPQSLRGSRAKGPYIPAFARIWCRHAVGASLSIRHERPIVSRTLRPGQETSGQIAEMSALPPNADMDQHDYDVRFVPEAEVAGSTTDFMTPACPVEPSLPSNRACRSLQ